MNANLKKGFAIALLFFCVVKDITAQFSSGKYEIGFMAGPFIYQGDLTPSPAGSYQTLRPTINLFLSRILTSSFSLRTSLFYGGLRGDDAVYEHPEWRQQRNFNFKSPALELSELLVWNAWSTEKKFTPYLFGGIGATFLNIKRDWSNFNPELFTDGDPVFNLPQDIAHKTPKVIPVVPVGIGFQFSVSKKLSIVGETAYRFTRTDYLDGFSKAANPKYYDHYQSHTIGLIYKPGKNSSTDCPVIVR